MTTATWTIDAETQGFIRGTLEAKRALETAATTAEETSRRSVAATQKNVAATREAADINAQYAQRVRAAGAESEAASARATTARQRDRREIEALTSAQRGTNTAADSYLNTLGASLTSAISLTAAISLIRTEYQAIAEASAKTLEHQDKLAAVGRGRPGLATDVDQLLQQQAAGATQADPLSYEARLALAQTATQVNEDINAQQIGSITSTASQTTGVLSEADRERFAASQATLTKFDLNLTDADRADLALVATMNNVDLSRMDKDLQSAAAAGLELREVLSLAIELGKTGQSPETLTQLIGKSTELATGTPATKFREQRNPDGTTTAVPIDGSPAAFSSASEAFRALATDPTAAQYLGGETNTKLNAARTNLSTRGLDSNINDVLSRDVLADAIATGSTPEAQRLRRTTLRATQDDTADRTAAADPNRIAANDAAENFRQSLRPYLGRGLSSAAGGIAEFGMNALDAFQSTAPDWLQPKGPRTAAQIQADEANLIRDGNTATTNPLLTGQPERTFDLSSQEGVQLLREFLAEQKRTNTLLAQASQRRPDPFTPNI